MLNASSDKRELESSWGCEEPDPLGDASGKNLPLTRNTMPDLGITSVLKMWESA